ncbi:MAG: Zn-dependent hydrolase [Acidobacteriota bacterium]
MRRIPLILPILTLLAWLPACRQGPEESSPDAVAPAGPALGEGMDGRAQIQKYTPVRLTTDLTVLIREQRLMVPLLMDAAREMDALFWEQANAGGDAILDSIEDPDLKRLVEINYGPWDRLDGNRPILKGVGPKPQGANFYPPDMTRQEFQAAVLKAPDGGKALKSLYTLVRRGRDGELEAVPYSQAFGPGLARAAAKLREAAHLAREPGLARYLKLRAEALLSDDYRASDLAWMEMKKNVLDLVIGPVETYEDQLFGYKAAFEAYVLVKDRQWSRRLARYAAYLPQLQKGLPAPAAYRRETPASGSDLNVYDVIFYAGDCNAGSKTIAINLPNDETVQLEKGTRRLQLKNAMRAKFRKILLPIAELLIDPAQRSGVTFDAFFANTMFHEVAHGLGIKNTLDGKGTVREALKENASAMEEGKADILGLYMITRLAEQGELPEARLSHNNVTFLASIFRSIRFGASSAHGRANLVRFNFFKRAGAFTRDAASGTYHVDDKAMKAAMIDLSRLILTLQGDGDVLGVSRLLADFGTIGSDLKKDLDRLNAAGIPVDVVFQQGLSVLQ